MFLAFDRDSVRSFDKDGHLHVEIANISKACVSPYIGREIPDWEKLGLDPAKTYKLLRAPDELERAAPTFAGKPVMLVHKPLSAAAHPYQKIVGAVGTDVRFNDPYLQAPLTIWPQDATAIIEAGKQKQLSCAYRYDPDMTPGEFEDESYDGVMRNIDGNHVAIVQEGRAGPDVVIGDSMENFDMAKKLTATGLLVQGAVVGFLAPKLAQDAKIDFTPAFLGVTRKNFNSGRPAMKAAIEKLISGKLAQDGNAEGLAALLDALSPAVEMQEGADVEELPKKEAAPDKAAETTAAPEAMTPEGEEGAGADPIAKIKAFLAGKLTPEDMKQLDAMVAAMGAPAGDEADEDDVKKDDEKEGVKAAPFGKDKMKANDKAKDEDPDMVTTSAMDAAIAAAVKKNTDETKAAQRDLREAERAVRPYVGELSMACDSAEAVYRAALKVLGEKDADKLHRDALRPIMERYPTIDARSRADMRAHHRIAQDSAADAGSFEKMFPEGAAIRFAS